MKYLILMILFTAFSSRAQITVEADRDYPEFDRMEAAGTKIKFFEKGKKAAHNVEIKNIKRIVQPAPDHVKSMIRAFREKKFTLIAEKGGAVLKNHEHSGWGKMICYIYSTALIRTGQAKFAAKVIQSGRFLIGGDQERDDDLLLKCAGAEVALVFKTANPEKIIAGGKPLTEFSKAAYYSIQGRILESQEKPNMAVISYYKSFMLGSYHPDCRKSACSVNAIYKKMNDPRQVPESLLSSKL